MPTLSVCAITKDAQQHLHFMLQSVKALAQQIVIVDTGSCDDTVQIARQFGADVFHEEWQNDFSKARNVSLSKATGDYILVLDADEELETSMHNDLLNLLSRPPAAYYLKRFHYWSSTSANAFVQPLSADNRFYALGARAFHITNDIRLFPRDPGLVYEGEVHETVEDSIRSKGNFEIFDSDVVIHHTGPLASADKHAQKNRLYLELTKHKIAKRPHDWRTWFQGGIEAMANQEFGLAVEFLSEALKLEQNSSNCWSQLGQSLIALGRYSEALPVLERALSLNKKCHVSWNALGVAFRNSNQRDQAEVCFKAALSLAPSFEVAKRNLDAILS